MDEKRAQSENLRSPAVEGWTILSADELLDQQYDMGLVTSDDVKESLQPADPVERAIQARDAVCGAAGVFNITDEVAVNLYNIVEGMADMRSRMLSPNAAYDLGLVARYMLAICLSVRSRRTDDIVGAVSKVVRGYDVACIFDGSATERPMTVSELEKAFRGFVFNPLDYARVVYSGMRSWPVVLNKCRTETDIEKLYNQLTRRVRGMTFITAAEFLRSVGIHALDSDNIPVVNPHITTFVTNVTVDIPGGSNNYKHPRSVSKLFREWCNANHVPAALASLLVHVVYGGEFVPIPIGGFDEDTYEYQPITAG